MNAPFKLTDTCDDAIERREWLAKHFPIKVEPPPTFWSEYADAIGDDARAHVARRQIAYHREWMKVYGTTYSNNSDHYNRPENRAGRYGKHEEVLEAANEAAMRLLEACPDIDINNKPLVVEKCLELDVDLRPRSGCQFAYGDVRYAFSTSADVRRRA